MKKRILWHALAAAFFLMLLFSGASSVAADAGISIKGSPSVYVGFEFSDDVRTGSIRYVQQNAGTYWYEDYWTPYEPEVTAHECYAASISMALSYIGIDLKAGDIVEGGNRHYVEGTEFLETTLPEAMERYVEGNGKYSPPVLFIKPYAGRSEGHQHWVVAASKTGKNTYHILDPSNYSKGTDWEAVIEGGTMTYWGYCEDTIYRVYQYYNPDAVIAVGSGKGDGGTTSAKTETVSMHRLYNPNSGEHFYTARSKERDMLVRLGWQYEGVGWKAPKKSGTPVYRLYNPNAGDHHYTMDPEEREMLIAKGWNDEGIGWYSDEEESVPLYRQYNPNAKAGAHNYTVRKKENDYLVTLGWRAEGIGWYGCR